ncbi:NifU family protein [Mycolicibacterium smegmatis]|uniref:NifU family protein n=1 Tax=Mycolicibacterium smegmatis TaxID=1772 RepID=UPI0002AC9693|nr:NifU family protein [Mycolicibacterium smegmatis]
MSITETSNHVRAAVDQAIHQHLGRFLDSHGGAVSASSVSPDGDVVLEFQGACRACPAVAATFYSKVAPLIRQVDGVRSVSAPNVHVSEAAVHRILALGMPTARPGKRTVTSSDAVSRRTRLPIQIHTAKSQVSREERR